MDTIIRAAIIYFGLLIILRFSGKRSLGQITTFDFVLLLIIGEAAQQGLSGEDYSVTNALLLVLTLILLDIGLGKLKERSPRLDRFLESVPVVLVENGRPLREQMEHEGVDESEILQAARELRGLERMEQIKYAVLERSGGISIVPMAAAGQE